MKDYQKEVMDPLKEFLMVLESDWELILYMQINEPDMVDSRDVKFLAEYVLFISVDAQGDEASLTTTHTVS